MNGVVWNILDGMDWKWYHQEPIYIHHASQTDWKDWPEIDETELAQF